MEFSRFWMAPKSPRSWDTVLMALSIWLMAKLVSPVEPMSRVLSPRLVVSAGERSTLIWLMEESVPIPTWKEAVVVLPSRRWIPLNSVDLAIRFTSLTKALNSSCRVSLSLFDTEPLEAWTASSLRRTRMLLTSFKAPSPVWTRETPSLAFRSAWARDRIWARSLSLMARPAESSAAVEMRRPVERCWKFLNNRLFTARRFRWALKEAMLVLTLSPMVPSPFPFPFLCATPRPAGAGFPGEAPMWELSAAVGRN